METRILYSDVVLLILMFAFYFALWDISLAENKFIFYVKKEKSE